MLCIFLFNAEDPFPACFSWTQRIHFLRLHFVVLGCVWFIESCGPAPDGLGKGDVRPFGSLNGTNSSRISAFAEMEYPSEMPHHSIR